MPAPELSGCTGVLVAGGRATRLGGVPKGLLRVNGEAIAARTLRLFARLLEASLVVANDPAPYLALGAPVIPDLLPGKGAPGGLHAALSAARTPWIVAVACDMPFVSEEGLRLLWARREGAVAVVPERGGRLEPLHALWSRAALPALDAALRAGDPSLQGFARACGARVVDEAAWREHDPAGRAFENVNTPEDAARLGLAYQE
jgi:molybdopterin-guanine dinucleotide biosynthesis protein A